MVQGKTLSSTALALSVLALSFSGTAGTQGGLAESRGGAAWPPHPSRIVQLSSVAQNAPDMLGPQQLWSAYGVPVGATLVVTDAAFDGEDITLGVGPGFRRRGTPGTGATFEMGADPGAPLGWTFDGGTQVVFQNTASVPRAFEYQLVGYLVKD